MLRDEAKWEVHKNDMCCFDLILEVVPQITVGVRPAASYLMNKTSWELLKK